MIARTLQIVSLAAALLVTAAPASAQFVPQWTVRWSVQPDAIGDEAYSVVTDDAGNIYVTGTTGTWGQLSLANIVTISYAPDGTQRWISTYNSPQDNQDLGVAITRDPVTGDLLVLGRSVGNYIVLRYDAATGAQLGLMLHDGGGTEHPNAFVVDAAGNIYITGQSWADNQNDIYTIKMSAAGGIMWTARYNGPGAFLFAHDVGYAIALAPDGHVVVTGSSNAPGSASGDYYTIKYNASNGATIWADRYSGGSNEVAYDLVIDNDGDVYVTGGSYQSGFKYVTIRYRGSDGVRLWTRIDAPQACNVATGIAMGSDGDLYVTGWSDPDCNESNFNQNITTIRYRSSDGVKLWQDTYGSNAVGAFDVPHDIIVDSADNVFVTGENTYSFVLIQYDPATGAHANLDTIDGVANELLLGAALALDPDENIIATGMARNGNTENRDILTHKYPSQVTALLGDLDGNGAVDINDLLQLLANWGACPGCPADLDGDGVVNIVDLLMLLGNWT